MEESIFESKSISKAYFAISLPVVFGMIVSIVYNITDTYFIALTDNTDLVAGVSLCAPIFTLLMAFGNIFGQGGSSLISRLNGEGDVKGSHSVSSFCFYTAILFGIVSGVLMLLLQTPFLKLLGADEGTIVYARSYFIWLAIGAPFVVLSFIHSNLLRAEGMAKESMFSTIGGSIINIILDPVLIFGLNLGAAGAAIATVVGYIFTDVFCLVVVFKKSRALSVAPGDRRICKAYVGQIFGVGTSAALSNITQSLCLILTNQNLLQYGSDKIAVMGIVQKISMIIMLVIVGFSFGGAPLIGYYFGAKNNKRLKELLKFVFSFLCGLALAMSFVMIAAAPLAMKIFIHDDELVGTGVLMLRTQVVSMVFMAIVLFATILFQAMGKSLPALALSLSRQGVIFVIVLYAAVYLAGYYGLLLTQAAADVISAVIAGVMVLGVVKKLKTADSLESEPQRIN